MQNDSKLRNAYLIMGSTYETSNAVRKIPQNTYHAAQHACRALKRRGVAARPAVIRVSYGCSLRGAPISAHNEQILTQLVVGKGA